MSHILRCSYKTLIWLGMVLTLGSCSYLNPMNWFGDDEVNPPARLVDIEQQVNLTRAWQVSVGNGQGDTYNELSPALEGNVIYVASENGTVQAVDADSGDTVWRVRLDSNITGGVGVGSGMVLLGTGDAEVTALDQANGEELWTVRVSSEVLSAPQTNGNVVVAQTIDGKLVALNAQNGEQAWIYETVLPALTLRGTSRPVITNTGLVIAGFSNGTLVAVSAEDGVYRWEERVAVPEGQYDIDRVIDVDGDLLLDGNRVFASSYQGNLMAYDTQTGRIVWGIPNASSYHGITRGFGNLYYCSDQGHIVAIRDNSDDVVWENDALSYRNLTAPIAFNNYVAVADFEGYVHFISQVDGSVVGRIRVDNDGVRSNLIVRGNRLYVYGNSGRLTALNLQ